MDKWNNSLLLRGNFWLIIYSTLPATCADFLCYTAVTNATRQKYITDAISEFTNKTCVRFVPYSGTETEYIAITDYDTTECSSKVGHTGGKQMVSLAVPGCFKVKRLFLHE
jgi:hypothetical protein